MVSEKLKVTNSQGFHMRPATLFVNEMAKFSSDVTILFNGNKVNAKSLMNLIAACIKFGTELTVKCDGPDEQEALDKAVGPASGPVSDPPALGLPPRRLGLEEAVRSRGEFLPAEKAVGRVARGYLWAYPPGIPLAVPGEELTADLAETDPAFPAFLEECLENFTCHEYGHLSSMDQVENFLSRDLRKENTWMQGNYPSENWGEVHLEIFYDQGLFHRLEKAPRDLALAQQKKEREAAQ